MLCILRPITTSGDLHGNIMRHKDFNGGKMFHQRPSLRAQCIMLSGNHLPLTVPTTKDGDAPDGIGSGAREARKRWQRENKVVPSQVPIHRVDSVQGIAVPPCSISLPFCCPPCTIVFPSPESQTSTSLVWSPPTSTHTWEWTSKDSMKILHGRRGSS